MHVLYQSVDGDVILKVSPIEMSAIKQNLKEYELPGRPPLSQDERQRIKTCPGCGNPFYDDSPYLTKFGCSDKCETQAFKTGAHPKRVKRTAKPKYGVCEFDGCNVLFTDTSTNRSRKFCNKHKSLGGYKSRTK